MPPVPGFVPKGTEGLLTLYAVWQLTSAKGLIFMQIAGTYDAHMQGTTTWVITGGTGGNSIG